MCRRAWVGVPVLLATLSAPAAAQTPTGDQRAGNSAYVVVLASRLNVRRAATLNAPVVGVALRSQRLCLVSYEGDWAQVVTPLEQGGSSARTRGFVSRGFVSHRDASPAELDRMGCGAESGRG